MPDVYTKQVLHIHRANVLGRYRAHRTIALRVELRAPPRDPLMKGRNEIQSH